MDDQFLHRLRRDPPTSFAVQLKWQLDRASRVRPLRARLLLVLAVCGTAFALVSPPGRRVVGDWFVTRSASSQPTSARAPDMGVAALSESARRQQAVAVPPRSAPAFTSSNRSMAEPVVASPQAVEAPVADIPEVDSGPMRVPTPVAILPVAGMPQTPEMQAAMAVLTRQGLFRTMGWVIAPLAPFVRSAPDAVDSELMRKGAIRLASLSGMIPEVFAKDTHAFVLNTRALAGIWANATDFTAKANDLMEAAGVLAAAAQAKDHVAEQRALAQVMVTCNACHDTYREKVR